MLRQPSLSPNPSGNQYELVRDYKVVVDNIQITVPKYFRYDGATIPAAAWTFTFSPFHPDVMLPSLVHDWMYFNHQNTRDETDDVFYSMLRENGVNNFKANAMWAAVRAAGSLFWDNDEDDEAMLLKLCTKVRERPNFNNYLFPAHIVQLSKPKEANDAQQNN